MNVNISSELPEAPYFVDLAYRMSDYKGFILGLCSDSINKDSQSSSSRQKFILKFKPGMVTPVFNPSIESRGINLRYIGSSRSVKVTYNKTCLKEDKANKQTKIKSGFILIKDPS